ncbi:hypothetical protein V1511DRAFT_200842 [Dipodascopsis uninucleata]
MNTKNTQSRKVTAKTSNVTSSTRIRDNQRRSRARRKEYVTDLEERLRRYESLGVEATYEVQAAGRKVAADNALLRSLLRHHGVAETEVQEYLQSHATCSIPSTTSLTTLPPLTSRLPTTDGDYLKSRGNSQLDAFHREPKNLLREIDAISVDPSPSDSVVHTYSNHMNLHAAGAGQPAAGGAANSVDVQENRAGQNGAYSTPCETAANLIMAVRGYPDMRDVRSELGCHLGSNCTARNMDIFEILDK